MRLASVAAAIALVVGCAPPPERELNVGMLEYAYLPAAIEVGAAERVRLVIKNVGRLEHDFNTGDPGRALGLEHVHLRPGEVVMKDWTAPVNPTSVRVVCTVVGHEQLGMVATLSVVARPSPSPSR